MKSTWTVTAQVVTRVRPAFIRKLVFTWEKTASRNSHCTIPGSFLTAATGLVPWTAKSSLSNSQSSKMSYSTARYFVTGSVSPPRFTKPALWAEAEWYWWEKPLWFASVITPKFYNALASISYQILGYLCLKELFFCYYFLELGISTDPGCISHQIRSLKHVYCIWKSIFYHKCVLVGLL